MRKGIKIFGLCSLVALGIGALFIGGKPLVLNASSSFVNGESENVGSNVYSFTASLSFPIPYSTSHTYISVSGSPTAGFVMSYGDREVPVADFVNVLDIYVVALGGSDHSIRVTPYNGASFDFKINNTAFVGIKPLTKTVIASSSLVVSNFSVNFPVILSDAENKAYKDGYQTGYDKGVNDGYNDGYTSGQSAGYDNGKSVGRAEGYQAGYSAAMSSRNDFTHQLGDLISTVVILPVSVIMEVLNFDILGVNVAGFVKALITFVLLLFIIRLIFNMPVKIDNGAKPSEPNQPQDHTTNTTIYDSKGHIKQSTSTSRMYHGRKD